MAESVKIDSAVPAPKSGKEVKRTEQWSSPYASYTTVIDVGSRVVSVKFAGNKLVLDLNKPEDAKISEILHASSRNHIDFEVISDGSGADVQKKAVTLKKLYDMSEATLARLIGPEKLKACGLPANCGNKEQLIVAFLQTNTLG